MSRKSSIVWGVIAAAGLTSSVAVAQDTKPAQPDTKPVPDQKQADPQGVPTFNQGVRTPEAIRLPKTQHDWGVISDTTPVEYTFEFTNITDETIRVNISASCGCTVGQIEKNILAPGETTRATARFDPKGRSGVQTKTVTISVTDPPGKYSNASMVLTSDVKALVSLDQPKLHFSDVDHRAGVSGRLVVTGRKEGFEVNSASAQHPNVKVKVGQPQPLAAGSETLTRVELEVTIEPGAPIGSLTSQITINTNDERVPSTTAMVSAEIVGTVRATPASAQVRVFTPKTPFSTQVRLDSRNGTHFNIRSIVVDGRDDMALAVDAVPNADNRSYNLVFAGTLPELPGFINGTIIVETDADGGETLRIPFTASVRPQQVARPVSAGQPIQGTLGQPADPVTPAAQTKGAADTKP